MKVNVLGKASILLALLLAFSGCDVQFPPPRQLENQDAEDLMAFLKEDLPARAIEYRVLQDLPVKYQRCIFNLIGAVTDSPNQVWGEVTDENPMHYPSYRNYAKLSPITPKIVDTLLTHKNMSNLQYEIGFFILLKFGNVEALSLEQKQSLMALLPNIKLQHFLGNYDSFGASWQSWLCLQLEPDRESRLAIFQCLDLFQKRYPPEKSAFLKLFVDQELLPEETLTTFNSSDLFLMACMSPKMRPSIVKAFMSRLDLMKLHNDNYGMIAAFSIMGPECKAALPTLKTQFSRDIIFNWVLNMGLSNEEAGREITGLLDNLEQDPYFQKDGQNNQARDFRRYVLRTVISSGYVLPALDGDSLFKLTKRVLAADAEARETMAAHGIPIPQGKDAVSPHQLRHCNKLIQELQKHVATLDPKSNDAIAIKGFIDGVDISKLEPKYSGALETKSLALNGACKLDLVLVPAGLFVMGVSEPVRPNNESFGLFPASQLERANAEFSDALSWYKVAAPDEKPAHGVKLTKPFFMSKYTVTQEQYQAVMETNPSEFKGPSHPVENVSWEDAQTFCRQLSAQLKLTVRLPTEAEWEYSCHAGTQTPFYSGYAMEDLKREGWFLLNSAGKSHPVGQKVPNHFGLYDMHGNVWQWCQDWYDPAYYGKTAAENPAGPTQGALRVIRGGCWGNSPAICGSTKRGQMDPNTRKPSIGFRVVVEPSAE